MDINQYNLEVFKYIRLEIDRRIEYHYKMCMWKIAIGGGLLAVLLEEGDKIPISPFFVSAIFLLLMDILVLENLSYIRSAGRFLKKNVENYHGETPMIRWESEFAQYANRWQCWSAEGYFFGVWSIAPMLAIIGLFADFNLSDKLTGAVLILLVYLCVYTIYMIHQTFNMKVRDFDDTARSPVRDIEN